MKPVDVKCNTYIDFKKEVNDKGPKVKLADHVRISKYNKIFLIKNISDVDTSSFELKSNLASLKNEVDKLHINKLKSLQNNLSNLKNKID